MSIEIVYKSGTIAMGKTSYSTCLLDINGVAVKVYSNKRGATEFNAVDHCDMCDPHKEKFVPKLVKIPNTSIILCKSCLDNLIKALDVVTIDDCKEAKQE